MKKRPKKRDPIGQLWKVVGVAGFVVLFALALLVAIAVGLDGATSWP